jgi:hypothetical protein
MLVDITQLDGRRKVSAGRLADTIVAGHVWTILRDAVPVRYSTGQVLSVR